MNARELVGQMTLEEKASLTSGAATFLTQGVERLDVPAFELTDGPHGLRKQLGAQDHLGQNESVVSTCFPAACALGSSFDPELVHEMGGALGRACRANGVGVLLGPGVNIKRSPLCGRNFEYFSEDPLVSGAMGAAWVEGIQSKGVGACVKHFLCNNQEARRRTQNSMPGERALREIYAPAFERVVKEARPWSVMAAYNKVDGTYMTQNAPLLKGLLRGEWGFDGLVVSDWYATHDRVGAVAGGCGLTMPSDKPGDQVIVDAVRAGELDEALLDEAAEQVVELALRVDAARPSEPETYDLEAAHALARRIAARCTVLLRNVGGILPLDPAARVAIIGPFADEPRYQGEGSSRVNAWRVPTLREAVGERDGVVFARGCGMGPESDEELLAEAVEAARTADVAVVMAGLPPVMEAEGYDRWVMKLPPCQDELIRAVCAAQPATVVVLQNGAPVEMPWRDEPAAIVEAYLGGEAASEAVWDVLTGAVNPSGHLAETFPVCLEDNPSYLFWPGEGDDVRYPEGVFVGYRAYASRDAEVAYPFGHGLSYTDFEYSDLRLSSNEFAAGDTLAVEVTVANVGARAGRALVQLYVGAPLADSGPRRPVRELRAFKQVALEAGESRRVRFELCSRDFAYWDESAHGWRVAGGGFEVQVCENAQSVLLSMPVKVADEYLPRDVVYTMMTPIGDVMRNPVGREFCEGAMESFMAVVSRMKGDLRKAEAELPFADLRPRDMGLMSEPLQTLRRFATSKTDADWDEFFERINAR